MRTIKDLLEAELKGEPLTDEEKVYLDKYRAVKFYRHSPKFIYHSRKLPSE